jgi:hypothetical protein
VQTLKILKLKIIDFIMKITDLNWLSGHWQGSIEGDFIEEIWSSVYGKSMIGMFRWFKNEIPSLLEFESINQKGDEIYLNLRHFDQNFYAHEDKEEFISFKLEGVESNYALFIHDDSQNYMRLSYTRKDPHTLITELKMGKKDPEVLIFNFKLFHY